MTSDEKNTLLDLANVEREILALNNAVSFAAGCLSAVAAENPSLSMLHGMSAQEVYGWLRDHGRRVADAGKQAA